MNETHGLTPRDERWQTPCWICRFSCPSCSAMLWCMMGHDCANKKKPPNNSWPKLIFLFLLLTRRYVHPSVCVGFLLRSHTLHNDFFMKSRKLVSTHSESNATVNENTFSRPRRHRSYPVSMPLSVIHRSCSPFVLSGNFSASPETHYTHIITNLGTNVTALIFVEHSSRPRGTTRLMGSTLAPAFLSL